MKKAADHFVHGEQSSREHEGLTSDQRTIFAAGIACCDCMECEKEEKKVAASPDKRRL